MCCVAVAWVVWCVSVTVCHLGVFFFFKQKTAYEMRISDWSSDVCSSDLENVEQRGRDHLGHGDHRVDERCLLHAAQDQEMEQPDSHRRGGDGDDGIAVAEYRKDSAQGRLDQHPVRHVADAASYPVPERGQKPQNIAEASLAKGEPASLQDGGSEGA